MAKKKWTAPARSGPAAHTVAAYALAVSAGAFMACGAPHMTPVNFAAPPSRVRFVPAAVRETPIAVTVTPPGLEPFTCVAPCSMLLPAGSYGALLQADGRNVTVVTTVPLGDSVARIEVRKGGLAFGAFLLNITGGAMATAAGSIVAFSPLAGIILASIAIAALLPGLIMYAASGNDRIEYAPASPDTFAADARRRRERIFSRPEDDAAPTVPVLQWRF